MILTRPEWRLWCLLALVATGGLGCEDTSPPPAHNRDLGTEGKTLLPTGSVWQDPAIAKGSADWHPLRELDLDAPTGSGGDSLPGDAVEGELRDLIADYNDVVTDATTEELLDYFVETQHDALNPWLSARISTAEGLAALRAAFEEKMADAKPRIASVFATLEAQAGKTFKIVTIEVAGETKATGSLSADDKVLAFKFEVVDDEWFMAVGSVEELGARVTSLDQLRGSFEGWLGQLQSGQGDPDTILTQVEQSAAPPSSGEDPTESGEPDGEGG